MPKAKNLESVRDEVVSLFHRGHNHQSILDHINPLLLTRSGQIISLRTLRNQISSWDLIREPSLQLEPLYDDIAELYDTGISHKALLLEVNRLLSVRDSPSISIRTLQTNLQTWGFSRYTRISIIESLVERIRFYFYTYGYNDESILRDLQSYNGIQVAKHTVR